MSRPDAPEVGWAVQGSADQFARRRARSASLKGWLSLRNLLVLVLLLWNGYFLAGLIYQSSVQNPSGDAVTRILITLGIWGDLAILLASWSTWAFRRRRRRAA